MSPCRVLLFFRCTTESFPVTLDVAWDTFTCTTPSLHPSLPSRRENPPHPFDGLICCPSHSSFYSLFLFFFYGLAQILSLSPSFCLTSNSFSVYFRLHPSILYPSFASGIREGGCASVRLSCGYRVISCAPLSSLPSSLSISLYLEPCGTLCSSPTSKLPLSLSLAAVSVLLTFSLCLFPQGRSLLLLQCTLGHYFSFLWSSSCLLAISLVPSASLHSFSMCRCF